MRINVCGIIATHYYDPEGDTYNVRIGRIEKT